MADPRLRRPEPRLIITGRPEWDAIEVYNPGPEDLVIGEHRIRPGQHVLIPATVQIRPHKSTPL